MYLDGAIRFAYVSSKCTLEAVASPVHYTYKSLNAWEKSVRCLSLNCLSAFRSTPRSIVLYKQETFRCLRPLSSWMTDYLTDQSQCTRMDGKTLKPFTGNSGMLQRAICRRFSSPLTSAVYKLAHPVSCLIMLMMLPSFKPIRTPVSFIFP